MMEQYSGNRTAVINFTEYKIDVMLDLARTLPTYSKSTDANH